MTSRGKIANEIRDILNSNNCIDLGIIADFVITQRQEAANEERAKIKPIPVDAEYFKAEIEKAKQDATIQTAERIKTVISDYSANSAKLAFNKCKKIIAEAKEGSKQC